MAKKINEEAGLENENPQGTPNEVEAPEVKINATEKKVRIRATEPIDCIIAGNVIKIAKDKEAQVAKDVAAILVNSRKAYRL